MTVTIRLFAGVRERIGAEWADIQLSPAATVADVTESLRAKHPDVGELIARSAVAVNGVYAARDQPIGPADEIALIPPVSGG